MILRDYSVRFPFFVFLADFTGAQSSSIGLASASTTQSSWTAGSNAGSGTSAKADSPETSSKDISDTPSSWSVTDSSESVQRENGDRVGEEMPDFRGKIAKSRGPVDSHASIYVPIA
jgi:hypothetical protein